MKTSKLIISFSLPYKILHYTFILCGGKFYFDYILPTNPTSKNPLWRKSKWKPYCNDPQERIIISFILAITHVVFAIVLDFDFIANLFLNIYPIVVQIYIGLRCWRIIKLRKKKNYLNLDKLKLENVS